MSTEDGTVLIERWRETYGASFDFVATAVEAEARKRLAGDIIERCVKGGHRDIWPTPRLWRVCVRCTPYLNLIEGREDV